MSFFFLNLGLNSVCCQLLDFSLSGRVVKCFFFVCVIAVLQRWPRLQPPPLGLQGGPLQRGGHAHHERGAHQRHEPRWRYTSALGRQPRTSGHCGKGGVCLHTWVLFHLTLIAKTEPAQVSLKNSHFLQPCLHHEYNTKRRLDITCYFCSEYVTMLLFCIIFMRNCFAPNMQC